MKGLTLNMCPSSLNSLLSKTQTSKEISLNKTFDPTVYFSISLQKIIILYIHHIKKHLHPVTII